MREWHLTAEALPSLILAADARLSKPNYFDDQIWELNLNSGEPAGLSLRTTYGLRARSMRLLPRFSEKDKAVSDTSRFAVPPVIHRFFPNYALLSASPFEGIDVIMEYWAPGSDHIGGRFRILNSGVTPRAIQLDWVAAMIVPEEEGRSLSPRKMEGVNVLAGAAGNLRPVIFLSGGSQARTSPSTSLQIQLELQPGLDSVVYWGHAAAPDESVSFELARRFATHSWEAEFARIEMTNAMQLEIQSGNPDWDLAFALGQTAAYRLVHGPTEHLPHHSYVHTRLPDQGYSLRGDGSDYDHLWNGQNVLETWHLANQLLPANPDLVRGFLDNFLHTQREDGEIDWQPSMNGKTSGTLATPILATLAWRIYQLSQDQAYLIKVFPLLQKFINNWFSPAHDRDGNGIPEWDHPIQTGFDDNPLFAHWQPWAQGAEIGYFESPSLCGMLYMECTSLLKIAREINFAASVPSLERKMARLKESLERAWDPEAASYRYIDRETRLSTPGFALGNRKGSGLINLADRKLDFPLRLSVRILRNGEGIREPLITILGTDGEGHPQKEEIEPGRVKWSLGWGTGVSEQIYSAITFVQVEGVLDEDEIFVRSLDYRHLDQTLLAPLWAGMPSEDQARALIKNTILNPSRFLMEYGLAACATRPSPESAVESESVWIPWNAMVGSGLVTYGNPQGATDLVSRLMAGLVLNIKKIGGFRRHHNARTGAGLGERDAVLGLPPLDLFLKSLGIEIFSTWRVRLEGKNHYPWPIRIKFRGLLIERGLESTEITFPNGAQATVSDPAPCTIDGKGLERG